MATSFSSSASSLSSLSTTRPLTGKSPLCGPRTPETVSQYSFHIVNAAVTGLRTSARLFTGDLVSPIYHHRRPSSLHYLLLSSREWLLFTRNESTVICRVLHLLPHFHPSGAIPSDSVLSSSFSRL